MGDDNVEVLWYVFCLVKAVILLVVFFAVALLCKWLLRRIPWKSVKRRPVKHAIQRLSLSLPSCAAVE